MDCYLKSIFLTNITFCLNRIYQIDISKLGSQMKFHNYTRLPLVTLKVVFLSEFYTYYFLRICRLRQTQLQKQLQMTCHEDPQTTTNLLYEALSAIKE